MSNSSKLIHEICTVYCMSTLPQWSCFKKIKLSLSCSVLRALKDECTMLSGTVSWPQFLIPSLHRYPCLVTLQHPSSVDGHLSHPLTEGIWLPHMACFWQGHVSRCEATMVGSAVRLPLASLPLLWEHAQTDLLEDERLTEHSQVSLVTLVKVSLHWSANNHGPTPSPGFFCESSKISRASLANP